MNDETKANWSQVARRDLPLQVSAYGLLLKMLFTAGCQTQPKSDPADDVFPKGQFIDVSYIDNPINRDRIHDALTKQPTEDFVYPDFLTPNPRRTNLPQTAIDKLKELRINSVTLGRVLTDNTFYMGFNLQSNVHLGNYFLGNRTENEAWPVYILAFGNDDTAPYPSQLSLGQMLSHGGPPNLATPINEFQMKFMNPPESLIGTEFGLIINKGVFSHFPDRATLVPVRFTIRQSTPTNSPPRFRA